MKQNQAYQFPFTPFPDGIFAVGFSHQLPHQGVMQITFMGEKLVLFRNEDGEVGAIESYCPHLGANLAGGSVKKNTLQCPFHGLRFNKNGYSVTKDCNGVNSYSVKSWEAFEQYGVIFLIHNPQRNKLHIRFPEWNLTNWCRPIEYCFKIKSHPQEILENSADQLHFFQVHKYLRVKKAETLQMIGPEFVIKYHLEREEGIFNFYKQKKIEFNIDIHAYGLGLSSVDIWLPSYGLKAKQIVLPTPIDGEFIHIRTLTSVKIPEKMPFLPNWLVPYSLKKRITNYLNGLFAKGFLNDFLPDLRIWEDKKYIEKPNYLANEEDIGKYRAWATQFYRVNASLNMIQSRN